MTAHGNLFLLLLFFFLGRCEMRQRLYERQCVLGSQIQLPLLAWILQKRWPVYTRQVISPLSCTGKSFKTNLKIVLIGRNTLFSNQSQLDQAWLSCMRFPALIASPPSTFGFVLLKYLDGFFFSTLSNKLAPFLICEALIS